MNHLNMLKLESLNTQLSTLRMAFDKAITEGNSFEEVKKIYSQIKELEEEIKKRKEFLGLIE